MHGVMRPLSNHLLASWIRCLPATVGATATARHRSGGRRSASQEPVPSGPARSSELEAIALLARQDRVRVRVDQDLLEALHHSAPTGDTEELANRLRPSSDLQPVVVEVASSDVRQVMRLTNCGLSIVHDSGTRPVVQLTGHQPNAVNKSSTISTGALNIRLGVKLKEGEHGKSLRLSANIDDYMLSIRVRQVDAFIQSQHVVTILVRLRTSHPVRQQANWLCTSGGRSKQQQQHRQHDSVSQLDGEEAVERQRMAKLIYDGEVERFVSAFSKIPSATVRVLDRNSSSEIVLLIRPEVKHQP